MYRVRKAWADVESQIGAFALLASAIDLAKDNKGYEVYDGKGKQVYPTVAPKPVVKPVAKPKVTLPKGSYVRGANSNAVKQIQEALNKLNFNCGTPDGVYGKDTADAIYRFQSVHCNPADGIYGENTRKAMEELLNK
jgi:peptidoglycan hydrolase-like protein with peptidoglycan-binding domain